MPGIRTGIVTMVTRLEKLNIIEGEKNISAMDMVSMRGIKLSRGSIDVTLSLSIGLFVS